MVSARVTRQFRVSMPFMTLFTVPKPFDWENSPIDAWGSITRIQQWACLSWHGTGAEILAFGHEAEAEDWIYPEYVWRDHHGVCHPQYLGHWGGEVERNAYGTPLLSDIFKKAQEQAAFNLVGYINADIYLLPDDFMKAVKVCADAFPHFLMCGRRLNTDAETAYKIRSDAEFENLARASVRAGSTEYGTLEGIGSSDYFVFRKDDLGDIPPYALGKFRWDNALMARAINRGMALIDATEAVLSLHPNHPPMPRVEGDVERIYNDTLVSQNEGWLGRLSDATHVLDANFKLHEQVKA